MKKFNAKVEVKLKPVVLDPQGKAVLSALHSLGFSEITETRVGKLIELSINEENRQKALARIEEMCASLLANPVIEDFNIELTEV